MNKRIIFCLVVLAIMAGTFMFFSTFTGWDYVPNRDIVVIKLHPDGSTAWMRTIDTGWDDSATDMAQLKNRDLLIAAQNTSERIGPSHSFILRLTSEGKLINEKVIRDYPRLYGILPTHDGGFAALLKNGGILRFDHEGKELWAWNNGNPGDQTWSYTSAGGAIETRDGGFAIPGKAYYFPGGAVVTKLDPEGTVQWKERVGGDGAEMASSIAESADGSGYLATVHGTPSGNSFEKRYVLSAAWLAANGTTLHTTRIGTTHDRPQVISTNSSADGDLVIYRDDLEVRDNAVLLQPVAVYFYRNGTERERKTMDAGPDFTMTGDGKNFSEGFQRVKRIQTSDGGYAILAVKEKR